MSVLTPLIYIVLASTTRKKKFFLIKDIQISKKLLFLFSGDMIAHVEKKKNSTNKILRVIKMSSAWS